MPVTKGGVAKHQDLPVPDCRDSEMPGRPCFGALSRKSLKFEAVEYSQNATHVRLQSTQGHSRKWPRFKVGLLFCELVIYTHKYKRERFNKKKQRCLRRMS